MNKRDLTKTNFQLHQEWLAKYDLRVKRAEAWKLKKQKYRAAIKKAKSKAKRKRKADTEQLLRCIDKLTVIDNKIDGK